MPTAFDRAVAALDITVVQITVLVVDSFNTLTTRATGHAETRRF